MNDIVPGQMIEGDWDRPGALSLVVQGGLSKGNLVETANHCRHWRQLFPAAEIILSVSGTDVLHGDVRDGVFTSLMLVPAQQYDMALRSALTAIETACDKVALAEPALPLPPIKSDSPKLNNMNLQLAAAQRGLSLATGRFVLRIRADLIFLDRRFLDQYAAAEAMPRGRAAVFERRVLISWLFTLNPFTHERMPLHFSDWFHFGLTKDVRRIWQAPAITLADSMYYRGHRHAPGSNAAERLFNIRLAVEQYIVYECFKTALPTMRLAYHNDLSSADLAMDVLLDNFAICDLEKAGCVFDKYSRDFSDHEKTLHCITRDDWFAMAGSRNVAHRKTLAAKIDTFERLGPPMTDEPVPRTYAASRLHTAEGRVLNGEIVAIRREGVLFWGPYTTLARGRYLATLDATSLEGPGTVILRVTTNSGSEFLAERIVAVPVGIVPVLAIPFDVTVAKAAEIEVICLFEKLRSFAVASVTFSDRGGSAAPAARYQQEMPLLFDAAALSTRDGHRLDGAIVASGADGILFYGPYATIAPGRYLARVRAMALEGTGNLTLRAVIDPGNRTIADQTFHIEDGLSPAIEMAFDIEGQESVRLEVVCDIEGLSRAAVAGIVITERPPDEGVPAAERTFEAPASLAKPGRRDE